MQEHEARDGGDAGRSERGKAPRLRRALGWAALGLGLLAAILVPFFLWEDQITRLSDALLHSARGQGLVAVGLGGLLAADVVLPVPSSVLSTAAGSLLGFPLATVVIWTGMMVGSAIGYRMGRGAASLGLGSVLGPGEAERAAAAFSRYGAWAIVLMRPVPVLAEASVIVAGFHGMPQRGFALVCALSNLGIAAVYAAIGAWAMGIQSFFAAFLGALALPALAFLGARRLRGGFSVA